MNEWKISEDKKKEIIKASKVYAEKLRKLGLEHVSFYFTKDNEDKGLHDSFNVWQCNEGSEEKFNLFMMTDEKGKWR